MEIDFDPAKDARNRRVHGISLGRYADIDAANAVVSVDRRQDYGEERLRVMGQIDGRLHHAVITHRQSVTRVISLRRANKREERTHAQAIRHAR